jgi:hypothetical protein
MQAFLPYYYELVMTRTCKKVYRCFPEFLADRSAPQKYGYVIASLLRSRSCSGRFCFTEMWKRARRSRRWSELVCGAGYGWICGRILVAPGDGLDMWRAWMVAGLWWVGPQPGPTYSLIHIFISLLIFSHLHIFISLWQESTLSCSSFG